VFPSGTRVDGPLRCAGTPGRTYCPYMVDERCDRSGARPPDPAGPVARSALAAHRRTGASRARDVARPAVYGEAARSRPGRRSDVTSHTVAR
jgi:hypothetical protein